MAHKFDRSKKDPYVEAEHQVERHVFSGRGGLDAGAGEELYDRLGDAIVTALGDIAAEAFRAGVNQPKQIHGLARAVAAASEAVFTSYLGEVDPQPAIDAIADDPRAASLPPEARDELTRELEKTRQLEMLLLNARRLPALMDFGGSLGLHVEEESIDEGRLLVPGDVKVGPGAPQLE